MQQHHNHTQTHRFPKDQRQHTNSESQNNLNNVNQPHQQQQQQQLLHQPQQQQMHNLPFQSQRIMNYSYFWFFNWIKNLTDLFLAAPPNIKDYNSIGMCGYILLFLSYALIVITVPFSLTICLKVYDLYFWIKIIVWSFFLFLRLF